MSKRIWITMTAVLAAGLLLSACGSNQLVEEDLTPIPSLRPGQTPTLIAALEGGEAAATTAEAEEAAEGTEEAPAEASTEEVGDATQEAAGDAQLGEELFAATCSGCHGDADAAGPARVGMGERAAERVEGMSAEEYLHESIVDPSAYIVEGYQDIMPHDYEEQFSEEEINSIVAYLMSQ